MQLYARTIELSKDKDDLMRRLREMSAQVFEIDERRKEEVAEIRKQADADKERLLREIAELRYQIGKLEERLGHNDDRHS